MQSNTGRKMKKTFLLSCGLVFILSHLFAQDIIYKSDGSEIKTKIIEITTEAIKYKKFEQLEGPVRNILLSDVFMIIYENGTHEVFKKTEQPENVELEKKETPIQVPQNIPETEERVETIIENKSPSEKRKKSLLRKSSNIHLGISVGFNSSKFSGDNFLDDDRKMVRLQGLNSSASMLLAVDGKKALQFEVIFPDPKGFRANSTAINNHYFEFRLNYIDFVLSSKFYLNKDNEKIFIRTSTVMGILTDGKIVSTAAVYNYNPYTQVYVFDHVEGPYKINIFSEYPGLKRFDWSWGLGFGFDFYLKKNQIITTEFKYMGSILKLDDKEDPWDYDVYNSLFGFSLYYYWWNNH